MSTGMPRHLCTYNFICLFFLPSPFRLRTAILSLWLALMKSLPDTIARDGPHRAKAPENPPFTLPTPLTSASDQRLPSSSFPLPVSAGKGSWLPPSADIVTRGAPRSGREKSMTTKAWSRGVGCIQEGERERKRPQPCRGLKGRGSGISPGVKWEVISQKGRADRTLDAAGEGHGCRDTGGGSLCEQRGHGFFCQESPQAEAVPRAVGALVRGAQSQEPSF